VTAVLSNFVRAGAYAAEAPAGYGILFKSRPLVIFGRGMGWPEHQR
jgi:hypothetical protein